MDLVKFSSCFMGDRSRTFHVTHVGRRAGPMIEKALPVSLRWNLVDITIQLAPRWTNASVFEEGLRTGPSPHSGNHSTVHFRIPPNCHLMTDATVRLLSLLNQLDHCTRRVVLEFEDGETGTMGHLNRIGFFDHLSPSIKVLPFRPEGMSFHGTNPGVVEIERIDRNARDSSLLDRLTRAAGRALSSVIRKRNFLIIGRV